MSLRKERLDQKGEAARWIAIIVGNSEGAGINRHVVGDERALQEGKQRIHPGLESCRQHREVLLEA
jgi:hypothetical protein